MKKLPILHFTIFLFLSFFFLLGEFTPAYSTAEDEIESEIEETQEAIEQNESKLESIEARIDEIKSSNYSVSKQISLITEEINKMEEEIEAKDKEIEKKLAEIKEKEEILESKRENLSSISSRLYMESRVGSVEFLFSNTRIDEVIRSLFVKRSAISILKDEITEITGEFEDLTKLKEELVEEKKELDAEKEDLDDSEDLLLAERAKLQSELNETYNSRDLVARTISGLQAQISDLQYHLLLVRQGGTNVDASSVPGSTENYSSLPGFEAHAPNGYYAVFSLGAHSHRNGMSQWGAKARADAGQNYTQILNHYYPGKTVRSNSVVISGKTEEIMDKIPVDGYGSLSFEDYYLLGIKEVPESWPMEILKAQAIAARTYAIRYTNNGRNNICTTQSCQVFSTPLKSGAWKTAVEATRGIVLVNSDGSPALTQYAAVHGGWSNISGWDTTDGKGDGDNWMAKAYESISEVSWFYKAWYIPLGSTSSCSRYPWMSPTEMADIANAYQVWKQTGGDGRIVPVADACHNSGDPYSYSEMRSLAKIPVSKDNLTNVIAVSKNGSTTAVNFYTSAGIVSIPGKEFKMIFNLRAPGHLHIPQGDVRYPAYDWVHINIEKN